MEYTIKPCALRPKQFRPLLTLLRAVRAISALLRQLLSRRVHRFSRPLISCKAMPLASVLNPQTCYPRRFRERPISSRQSDNSRRAWKLHLALWKSMDASLHNKQGGGIWALMLLPPLVLMPVSAGLLRYFQMHLSGALQHLRPAQLLQMCSKS